MDIQIDPIYSVDRSSKIDTSKLKVSPGKWISVDGSIPVLEVTQDQFNAAERAANPGSYHSYPKIWALGHRAVVDLLKDPVLIEEKVDGSQFSFGKFLDPDGGTYLRCRSKGAEVNMLAPEGMFVAAVETVKSLESKLHVGWTYRGEYLSRPKHNVLAYDRIPDMHVILFDVNTGNECYLNRAEKEAEAERLGLEIVPVIYQGHLSGLEEFRTFLEQTSVLGGQKIEGVVIKNYNRFGIDGKALMGKFVSELYKEVHQNGWKEANPKQGDILVILCDKYKTPARWLKAIQHLKEQGKLEGSPKDIGLLFPEVVEDVEEECKDEIKEMLWKWAWPSIKRSVTHRLPEFYKEQLLLQQFEEKEND